MLGSLILLDLYLTFKPGKEPWLQQLMPGFGAGMGGSSTYLTAMTLWRVLDLKFKDQSILNRCCETGKDERQWSFGQILAVIMLLSLLYPTLEAYFGMQSRVDTTTL